MAALHSHGIVGPKIKILILFVGVFCDKLFPSITKTGPKPKFLFFLVNQEKKILNWFCDR